MHLYTYYTSAMLILIDVFICYVELYIYFDKTIDFISFFDYNKRVIF